MEFLYIFTKYTVNYIYSFLERAVIVFAVCSLFCTGCSNSIKGHSDCSELVPPDSSALELIQSAAGNEVSAGIRKMGLDMKDFEQLSSGTLYRCQKDIKFNGNRVNLLIETYPSEGNQLIGGVVYSIELPHQEEIITSTIISWYQELLRFHGKPDTYEGMGTERISSDTVEQFAAGVLKDGSKMLQLYEEWQADQIRLVMQAMKIGDSIVIQTMVSPYSS